MKKIQKIKQAIKNPPPERLAKIEYKSHLYQAFGIAFVCTLLIWKGFWYVIFAFIFGIGISYSQGMAAHQRYQTIMQFKTPEKMEDFQNDISPTRRRSKIITSVMRSYPKFISIALAVVGSYYLIGINHSRLILSFLYPLSILGIFVLSYFYMFYWLAYPIYKNRLKGGNDNE